MNWGDNPLCIFLMLITMQRHKKNDEFNRFTGGAEDARPDIDAR